jgi:hypothetical protein
MVRRNKLDGLGRIGGGLIPTATPGEEDSPFPQEVSALWPVLQGWCQDFAEKLFGLTVLAFAQQDVRKKIEGPGDVRVVIAHFPALQKLFTKECFGFGQPARFTMNLPERVQRVAHPERTVAEQLLI